MAYSLGLSWTQFDVLQKVLKGMRVESFKLSSLMSMLKANHEKQRRCSVGTAMQLKEGFSSNIWVGKFALSACRAIANRSDGFAFS